MLLQTESHGMPFQGSTSYQQPISGKGLLNSKNFEKSREAQWKNLRQLKIDTCDKLLFPSMLSTFKTTLTYVEFSSLTSLKNIQLLLMLCSNLEIVNFNNVTLSHYNEESHRCNLFLRTVNRLIFGGMNDLTNDELHLFHYLNQKVKFENLKTLAFETRPLTTSRLFGQKNYFNPDINSTVLGDFIVKHRSVLRNMEMNRTQLTLFPEGTAKAKARNVNLSKVVCDVTSLGLHHLLNYQFNITILHCYNSENLPNANFKSVLACIKKCKRSIRDVRIDNRVRLAPPQDANSNEQNQCSKVNYHDMSTYKDCDKLRKLNINLSMRPSTPEEEKRILSPGGIVNCSELSVHLLTNIAIRFDFIDNEEMERFASLFSRMKNTKFFLFHGNIETPYKVKLSYVQDLVRLPKIMVFELCFCFMEDIDSIEQYRESHAELEAKLGITPHSVIYWKNK